MWHKAEWMGHPIRLKLTKVCSSSLLTITLPKVPMRQEKYEELNYYYNFYLKWFCNMKTLWNISIRVTCLYLIQWIRAKVNTLNVKAKSSSNLLSPLLRCGTRPNEWGTQWDPNLLEKISLSNLLNITLLWNGNCNFRPYTRAWIICIR